MLKGTELSYTIRDCVYEVARKLGCDFHGRVYENALLIELRLQGLHAESQVPFKVYHKDTVIGQDVADVLVEGGLFLELKAHQGPSEAHEVQLLNFLKATDIEVGVLVNFACPGATINRLVL